MQPHIHVPPNRWLIAYLRVVEKFTGNLKLRQLRYYLGTHIIRVCVGLFPAFIKHKPVKPQNARTVCYGPDPFAPKSIKGHPFKDLLQLYVFLKTIVAHHMKNASQVLVIDQHSRHVRRFQPDGIPRPDTEDVFT